MKAPTLPRKLKRDPVIQDAIERGWHATMTAGGHVRVENNGHVRRLSATPSDRRSRKNEASQLRKCERNACTHNLIEPARVAIIKPRPAYTPLTPFIQPPRGTTIMTPIPATIGMTTREAGEYLDVSTTRIDQLRKAGKLDRIEGERPARYTLASIEQYDKARRKYKQGNKPGPRPKKAAKPITIQKAATLAVNASVTEQAKPAGRAFDRADIILAKIEGYTMNDSILTSMLDDLRIALGKDHHA